jgi:hypothetical protein
VNAGLATPATSCSLFTIQSSAPSAGENPSSQLRKTSAAITTRPSATPRRGWSAQPPTAYEVTLHPAVGSLARETATSTLLRSTSEIDANQRPLDAS